MKLAIKNWANSIVGEVEVAESIFGCPPRQDILARVIAWQLAKRRSGNHKTKGIKDVSGTTRKPFKQKGTGRARQGSLRSPQFRKGAVIFGPVVRDHSFSLNKKIRQLGLRVALSVKLAGGQLEVFDNVSLAAVKTKDVLSHLKAMELSSVLFIDGPEVCDNLRRSVANIPCVDVLPQHAMNVYDIMRHRHVVLSSSALAYLQERFL